MAVNFIIMFIIYYYIKNDFTFLNKQCLFFLIDLDDIIISKLSLMILYKGNLLKNFPKSNPIYMKENNINKDIVIYGSNLNSSVNLPKFTKIVSYMCNIPYNILNPLIGIILSDGNIEYKSRRTLNGDPKINYNNNLYTNINSRFRFKQSIDHSEYLFFVYNIVSPYCISYPRFVSTTIKGRKFSGIEIITRALPCFTYLRNNLYRGRIKIIPDNLYDLLTYEGLAHIIMGDGSFQFKGIVINFQSYSVKELILFMNVLKIKFDLDCTLHKSRHQYTVYIKVESVKRLYPKIKNFIVPSMRYKFEKKILV